jgi:hypothetical protein
MAFSCFWQLYVPAIEMKTTSVVFNSAWSQLSLLEEIEAQRIGEKLSN